MIPQAGYGSDVPLRVRHDVDRHGAQLDVGRRVVGAERARDHRRLGPPGDARLGDTCQVHHQRVLRRRGRGHQVFVLRVVLHWRTPGAARGPAAPGLV